MKNKKIKTMTPKEKFEKLKKTKAKGLYNRVSGKKKSNTNSNMNAGYNNYPVPPFQGEQEEAR